MTIYISSWFIALVRDGPMIARLTWTVSLAGYQWKKLIGADRQGPGLALVPKDYWSAREYDSAEEQPGLFREFVATPPTKDGILRFANRFGTLGQTIDIQEQQAEPPAPPDPEESDESVSDWERKAFGESRYGDWFVDWKSEIEKMSKAVAILDRQGTGCARPGDLLRIQDSVNAAFERTNVRAMLTKTRKTKHLAVHVAPVSLAGLMWAQFALAVSGNKEFRQCPSCSRWLEISAERGRQNQEYCGEACRARAYRRRKSESEKRKRKGTGAKRITDRE